MKLTTKQLQVDLAAAREHARIAEERSEKINAELTRLRAIVRDLETERDHERRIWLVLERITK